MASVLTGCAGPEVPAAVATADGAATLMWKFCDAERGIGDVAVARVTDDAPEDWPTVWRARLDDGATPLHDVPVAASIDGYLVETQDWPLRPGARYAVVDASDAEGYDVLFVVLEFEVPTDGQPALTAEPETALDLAGWLGRDGPSCG